MTTSPSSATQTTFRFDASQKPPVDEGTTRIAGPRTPGAWRLWAGGPVVTPELELRPGQQVVIGSGREATVRVADPTVSRQHCQVIATELGLNVVDLDSTNGTFVAGVRVASAVVNKSGPGFVVGRTTIYVRAVSSERSEATLPGLIGKSEPIKRLVKEVRCFAPHDVSVLIHGETGSGKDVVARAIHDLSGRKGPFVAVNIGALQDSLADAELFGHRKGAFTGAIGDRKGAFEQAHGGTLFLDEIGDISPAVQVKLLRAIEDKRIRAVGAERETTVDVRVVAASWAHLEQLASQGRFRWDLYHRLATAVIRVPALRERRSDIEVLVRHFLATDLASGKACDLTEEALDMLRDHDWAGNVRELRAALKRAAMLAPNGLITAAELHFKQASPAKAPRREPLSADQAAALLRAHGGNVSAAARAAGLPRSTFRNALAGTYRLSDLGMQQTG